MLKSIEKILLLGYNILDIVFEHKKPKGSVILKKKILSIVLAAAMIMSVLSIGMISVSAAEDGKIKKNRVQLNHLSSETENLPDGEELSSYIAQKKTEFENRVNTIAGANGEIEDYSQLFTGNTYAVVDSVSFGSVFYEESDDAIVIGDRDNWDGLYVLQGWIARVTIIIVNYKLVTVDESAPVGGVIDTVELTVTAPEAGANSKTSPPQVQIDSENCSLFSAVWLADPNGYSTEEYDVVFEGNKGYNMLVTLKADDGYTFEKTGKPYTGIDEGFDHFDGCIVNYGNAFFAGSRTFDDGDYLRLKINVIVPGTYPEITGDANGDTKVDILDAAAIQKFSSGKSEMSAEQQTVADVNGDTRVDILDATIIQKFAAGKITEFTKKS